jgi:hypothetical protein
MKNQSRRRALIAAGLVVGAVAMFAGGALVANATRDSNGANSKTAPSNTGPGPFASKPASGAPAPGFASQGSEDAASRAGLTILPNYCPGKLEGVVNGNTIDLTGKNFRLNLLKDGFALSSITIAAVGDCDESGNATNVRISVDSSWVHTATGAQVWLNQREEPVQKANVEYEGSATFWVDGYSYSVSAGIYTIMIDDGREPARDLGYQQASKEVIDAAVAQLAPGLDRQCFYRQAQGGWADLLALGVGDPRPAIPSGYTESYINVSTFTSPPASCNQPPLEDVGYVYASAAFSGDMSYLGVEVQAMPGGSRGYSYLTDYVLNWSNGRFQFNVWAKSEPPLGRDALIAIARALDPSFSAQCLPQLVDLTEGEILAAGFHVPQAPDGYAIAQATLTGTRVDGACSNPPEGFEPAYHLYWTLKGEDGTTVDVYVNRYEGAPPAEAMGWISDFGLNWTDAKGTNYSVNGSTIGVSPVPQRDVLVSIAESLDPTLDVSKLQEQEEGPIRGQPGYAGPDAPASDAPSPPKPR